jgi:predicted DNA-binding transcriptional regulator AlpA
MATETASAAGERLITAQELGELLQLSTSTVLDWFEDGKFDGCAFRLGGKKGGPVRFRLSEIDALLETWRVSGSAEGDRRKSLVLAQRRSAGPLKEHSVASPHRLGPR